MIRFLSVLAAVVCFSGCVGGSFGPSVEWRLRNLEKNFLEFQDRQLEQDARIAALEESRLPGSSKIPDQTDGPAARPGQGPGTAPKVHLLKSAEVPSPHRGADKKVKEAKKSWEEYPSPEDAPAPKEVSPKPVQEAAEKTEAVAKQTVAAAKKPVEQPRKPGRKATDSGAGVYARALKLVLAGKPQKGRVELAGFMEKYPRSPLMPNAVYWTGETYYSQKRYAQAILTFKQVPQKFPGHEKAAAALLKIGYAYDRLGDKNNARFYLDALVQDYPDSEPAALARKKLKALSR